jgi:hypothetical protein
MAALTADRTGTVRENLTEQQRMPVAASTTIYNGALVSFDATGYLVPAADSAGQDGLAIYYALEGCDNSAGIAGEKSCLVMTRGSALLAKGVIVQADAGKIAHAADDGTLALTSTNNRPIGRIARVGSTTVAVQIG